MTLVHLAHAAFHTLRISAPTVLEGAFGALSADDCDRRLQSWSRALVAFAGVQIELRGEEPPASDGGCVVMSNHQSHYDIPVLFQTLRRRLRMVAKTELFRIPIWGRAMRAAGMVEVDRKNRETAIESLNRARAAIRAGTSVWIAPEGTRSPDGLLGEFKKGGFHLAFDLGAPILPISIDGTRRVLPAKGRRVSDGERVRVSIHAPIAPSPAEPLEALVERVRAAIASGLP